MKAVMLVLITGALGAAGFWYITENARKDRRMEQQAKAEEKERIARQKAEDERIRKERAAAAAKEDAVRLFLNYIDREESRLKEEIEEAKINLEKIDVDQESLDVELRAIERTNAMRVSSGEKRGESQRDKVERVRELLKSAVLNRLARTYCGNDLSALRSEFEGEMQKIKDVDDRYVKRFGDNLKKYDETVKGVDDAVLRKTGAARAKLEDVQRRINNPQRLSSIKSQFEIVKRRIDAIMGKQKSSGLTRVEQEKLERLQGQQTLLQNQLAQYEEIAGLAAGNIAHIAATEAETEARRKYDQAGKALIEGNDMALLELTHEQTVYNRVREFEKRSLDNVRSAMNDSRLYQKQLQVKAEKCLGYLKTTVANIDFLDVDEIENVRRDIAKRITKPILEMEDGKW